MRTNSLFIIFNLIIACYSTNVLAENWLLYSHGPGGVSTPNMKSKYYYDTHSIKEVDTNVYEFKHKHELTKDGYIISQYWVNCNQRKFTVGEYVTYILGEKIDSGNNFNGQWYTPPSYDPHAKLINTVCY